MFIESGRFDCYMTSQTENAAQRCSAYIFPALNPFRLTFLRMRESDAGPSCYAGCLRIPTRGTHR